MSTVHVVLDRLSASSAPLNAQPESVQTITSSNSASVASTIAVPAEFGGNARGWNWAVTALDGDIWVAFGANPVAGSGAGYLLKSGETRSFQANTVGEKIAVRDVA